MKNLTRGILSIILLGSLLAIFPNTSAAQKIDPATMPVWGEDLDKVMAWIAKETSRQSLDFCWKDTYARQTYTSQKQCEDKEGSECVQLGLLWYVKCLPGYETSVVPHCLAKCPTYEDVVAGAPNVKNDCGLACSLGNNECAEGVQDMVFAPINLVLNIVSLGLSSQAQKAAKQTAIAGTNAALGGAASQATAGITRATLINNRSSLLQALDKAEEVFEATMAVKDQTEQVQQIMNDLNVEMNRWNKDYVANFSELTSPGINAAINKRFPLYGENIKAAYAQYVLQTMLEVDGWRIAKSVLSNASYFDPIGILETINAFAHPICDLSPHPFPDVKILTTAERMRNATPYVRFYAKDGITLEEVKKIAKQKNWTLASKKTVYNACAYGDLNMPYLGWAVADKYGNFEGSFVLPQKTERDVNEREEVWMRKIWENIYWQGPGGNGDSKNTVSDIKGFYYWSEELVVNPVNESDLALMQSTARSLARRAAESGAQIGFNAKTTQRFAKEAAIYAELAIDFEKGYFGDASARDVLTAAVENNQVDAALFHHGSNFSYFFQGNRYYRFNGTTVDEGYPLALPGGWEGLPNSFLSDIDATVYKRDNNKIYFFKGDEFVRITGVKVDPGYPKKISEGFSNLPPDFHRDIEAALYSSGKTYLFKNNEYVRISGTTMEAGYPTSIKGKWGFSSEFTQGIDAALPFKPNSKNYIFAGGKYARLSGTGMDIGYPLYLPGGWEGLQENRAASIYVNEVKFYSKNGVTLEEAQKIAWQNDWKLASDTDLTAAFKYKNLDVYAFGMMEGGRFAVPVQGDHVNFTRGTNIGATGGNQGFFYVPWRPIKEVKFHSQNSMTLAQARSLAKQNSWTIATADEIQDAWDYRSLNVYAYGMMADGRFAVPVQSDVPNFNKGPNIGVTGGNQGFFYTVTRTNIALNKPAKQSSQYGTKASNGAQLANDGIVQNEGQGGLLQHTNLEQNPWWEVDLQGSFEISSITLYNRTNCCPERLNNFTILVSDTPFTGNSGGTVFISNQAAPNVKKTYTGTAKGRYVRLFTNQTNYMSIPEIEIFGTPK